MTPHASTRVPAFTLVETLAVLVLLGIAATLVLLRLPGSDDGPRLRAAAQTLEQTFQLVRNQARTRRQTMMLELEPGTNRYRWLEPSGICERTPWRQLDGVDIDAARSVSGAPVRGAAVFTIRIGPTGACPPWAARLRRGAAGRLIWCEGITGVVHTVDSSGTTLDRWEPAQWQARRAVE